MGNRVPSAILAARRLLFRSAARASPLGTRVRALPHTLDRGPSHRTPGKSWVVFPGYPLFPHALGFCVTSRWPFAISCCGVHGCFLGADRLRSVLPARQHALMRSASLRPGACCITHATALWQPATYLFLHAGLLQPAFQTCFSCGCFKWTSSAPGDRAASTSYLFPTGIRALAVSTFWLRPSFDPQVSVDRRAFRTIERLRRYLRILQLASAIVFPGPQGLARNPGSRCKSP